MKATFLLSGWEEGRDGGLARHVVRLVEGKQVRWWGGGEKPGWAAAGASAQAGAVLRQAAASAQRACGRPRDAQGRNACLACPPPSHTLAPAPQLEAEKARLKCVQDMHVYSVQPGVPKVHGWRGMHVRVCGTHGTQGGSTAGQQGASTPGLLRNPSSPVPVAPAAPPPGLQDATDLYNCDYAQTAELFAKLLSSSAGGWGDERRGGGDERSGGGRMGWVRPRMFVYRWC